MPTSELRSRRLGAIDPQATALGAAWQRSTHLLARPTSSHILLASAHALSNLVGRAKGERSEAVAQRRHPPLGQGRPGRPGAARVGGGQGQGRQGSGAVRAEGGGGGGGGAGGGPPILLNKAGPPAPPPAGGITFFLKTSGVSRISFCTGQRNQGNGAGLGEGRRQGRHNWGRGLARDATRGGHAPLRLG
jgi:hypothetical protein